MVKTRSQSGEEATEVPPVTRFDDPPRSPSTEPPTAGSLAAAAILAQRGAGEAAPPRRGAYMSPLTELGAEPSTSRQTAGTRDVVEPSQRQVSPVRSVASNSSVNARVRQAQFEAEERLALIRQKQLELDAERIKRRLAYDVELITETEQEGETEPPHQHTTQEQRRVESWLAAAKQEEHRTPHNPEQRGRPSYRNPEGRPRSPTPGKGSRGRGIEQLVDALEKMARNRPPPRQAYDLPTFSGAPIEWFAFRAAMRDTTKYYNLTKTENMARLRNCLKGEAREAVSVLLHSVEDPQVIMETLEQTFGQPEVLVDKTIDDLRKLPRPGTTATELNNFAVKVQNIVWVLKSFDKRGYLSNPQLTRDIMTKLSPHMLSKWYEYAEQNDSELEIIAMSQFLMKEAKRALRFGYIGTATGTQKKEAVKAEQRKGKQVYATSNESETLRKCQACQQNHSLPKCSKFSQMKVAERWELVKKEKLCFKCLASRHRRFNCRAKSCGVKECRMGHHQLLHEPRTDPTPGGAPTQSEPASENAETVTATSDLGQVKLKICPVTVSGPKGQAKIYALLDEGSTVSMIDEEIAQKIGARGPAETLRIRGVSACLQEHESRIVKFKIEGTNSQDYLIKARTIGDMKLSPQCLPRSLLRLNHLKDLDPNELCYENGKPQLLIGSDNWELIVSRELRLGKRNEPAASRTQLGWVIHGTVPRRVLKETAESVLHVVGVAKRLEDLVEEHFKIDALGVTLKPKVRAEDERAVAIFNQTAKRVNGRFEVGLPWREDATRTPPSYHTALQRLESLERKLGKSEDMKKEYDQQIKNLLDKKYAEPCNGSEKTSNNQWYLPHFPVLNPNKPGKVRLVFDAAAKSRGVSLNDFLLDGPDLLQSLPVILFRFREFQIGVTADIKEMFLQVKIREEDQPAQMFLWRPNEKEPIQEYKMTSMIFGARSSPFMAHSVRNRNARDYEDRYPEAMKAITESHYMDDYVDSFHRTEDAEKVINDIIKVHSKAGFELRGWSSNCNGVLRSLPEDLRAKSSTQLLTGFHEQEKTLGLRWDTVEDSLGFNTTLSRVDEAVRQLTRAPTKREALSAVMSLYDPLGLLSCYTITGKILLQKLWREKLAWDEPLPHEFAHDFEEWINQMQYVSRLRLPRWYQSSDYEVKRRQLHIFCDASEEAYATAAYWRLEKEDGTAEVSLIAAKAKVAPLRSQTIPRLELQAAVIGTRLASTIQQGHRWEADEVTFWTDSRTVLQWIQNDTVRYTPFVAHRLGEIAEATRPRQWRWVPTEFNVADIATRPNYVPTSQQDRWFRGPNFLQEDRADWPQFARTEGDSGEKEEYVLQVQVVTNDSLPDIGRFSKFERLIRATAMVILFTERCRQKTRHPLEARHLKAAEKLWVQKSQTDSFSVEMEQLRQGKTISRSSRLNKLDPILSDGVLRLNGRIGAAEVSSERKQPIILDGRHPYTKMMIQHYHEDAGHANPERVVNEVRQHFWVLRLRPAVRAAALRCAMCRVRKAKPEVPVKGDLPAARIQPFVRPFSNCGVDYFGPMVVTIGRRHEKRWGALFTCLTTRAIHLELVASLSTDSAIMALRRMASRRGWPAVIYSDNGTNFRGADAELRAAYTEWTPALRDYGLLHRVTWRFIPPGAPNQGGAWERLVRSVKTALSATLSQKAPKEEVLLTLLAEAEHSINARPLTHVSVDPNDPEALTPNHFLLGSSAGLPTTGPCDPADRRTWRATQALADEFWRRWVREYLPDLTPRRESAADSRPLREGDLVVVVDPALPRNTWPRGVIERVYPGRDGRVRIADVRTRGGVFRRPATKLAILPVEGCAESSPGGEC